jgi:hypothetical protein
MKAGQPKFECWVAGVNMLDPSIPHEVKLEAQKEALRDPEGADRKNPPHIQEFLRREQSKPGYWG